VWFGGAGEQVVAHAAGLAAGYAQAWRQLGALLLAFGLSSVVGMERELRGKSAGLRTQAIVGTSAALFLLVSKYGFADVLSSKIVVLDPSRVAAQIVSGIGFLGAGLIITRRGTVHGLTTAAAVWETAAIGMAAGAGLTMLACAVTALHFVIVFGYTALSRSLPWADRVAAGFTVIYEEHRGVLRDLLAVCTARGWSITSLTTTALSEDARDPTPQRLVSITLDLWGPGAIHAAAVLGEIAGVLHVERRQDEGD
jgi:putative Mg2+ transporter-C (MgtC) family protein